MSEDDLQSAIDASMEQFEQASTEAENQARMAYEEQCVRELERHLKGYDLGQTLKDIFRSSPRSFGALESNLARRPCRLVVSDHTLGYQYRVMPLVGGQKKKTPALIDAWRRVLEEEPPTDGPPPAVMARTKDMGNVAMHSLTYLLDKHPRPAPVVWAPPGYYQPWSLVIETRRTFMALYADQLLKM